MFSEGVVKRSPRLIEVAVGGGQQSAAPLRRRQRQGAPRRRCSCFELLQMGRRLFQLSEPDQRLDRVRPHGKDGRLVPADCDQPCRQLAQVCGGGLEVSERQLEEPEHAEVLYLEDPVAGVASDRQPSLGGCSALLGVAEVGIHECSGIQR